MIQHQQKDLKTATQRKDASIYQQAMVCNSDYAVNNSRHFMHAFYMLNTKYLRNLFLPLNRKKDFI